MYIPKKYGQSKVERCPFCGKIALAKNKQGIPVCHSHKGSEMKNLKCACGNWLDVCQGKWGPYFRCTKCGNISFRKGMEMNPVAQQKAKAEPKEINVTSDEVDFI